MSEPRYCSLLWTHMSNEPLGQVRTCCIANKRVTDESGEEFTLGKHSVKEIFHSEFYKNIRQEIRDGKLPDNCKPCWDEEERGMKSKREIYNEYSDRFGTVIDYLVEPNMPQDFQLIFNNVCNIKCRMCNPQYSTKWVQEAEERGLPYRQNTIEVDMMDKENSQFWKRIDEWIPHIKRLEIMGGEPFYVPEFREFVDILIEKNISKKISISFSTNGTIVDKDFIEKLINNFDTVGFNVSIDGATTHRFEYIRHGALWNEVSKNLDYLHGLHATTKKSIERHETSTRVSVGITCTITALNVMYLPEYHKIFEDRWPEFEIFHNIAHKPTWYNPNVFPTKLKSLIADNIKMGEYRDEYKNEINGIVKQVLSDSENPKGWDLFQKQVVSGDSYRKEDFRKSFSKLYNNIKDEFDYEKHYTFAQNDIKYGATKGI